MSVPPQEISDQERFDRLRLIRSENVGPRTYYQLMRRFDSAADALTALPDLAKRGGLRRRIKIAGVDQIRKEFDNADAVEARFIANGEPDYPPALAVLADAPPLICLKGHAVVFRKHALAIVGARNASAAGRQFAREIAHELGAADLLISSGMARGIDTAAHQGALPHGTVAVLAGGVDNVFPPENQGLYEQIAETGAIVSEMPVGTVPRGRHFPQRNRIISGIAHGTLVVEAALRSGSLITARFALEQGREVFAVPGSPKDPRCTGTNNLIRQGAQLTESVEDIMTILRPMLDLPLREPEQPDYPAPGPELSEDLDDARSRITGLLGPTAVEIDELIRQSELTPALVLTILLELDLAGRLERHAGQKVSLRL